MIGAGHSGNGKRSGQNVQESATSDPELPFDALGVQARELWEYARHYVEVRKDSIKAQLRNLAFKAIMGIAAGISALVALSVAVTLILLGLADGIGVLLGGRLWAGELIVGFLVVALAALAVKLFLSRSIRSSRSTTVAKYEHRHEFQRAAFGHDVTDRAAGCPTTRSSET